jgi:hypothetical protein
MSILIRDEHEGVVEYRSHEDSSLYAIEAGGSVVNPGLERVDRVPGALIVSDDAGHSASSPDDKPDSWLMSWSQTGWAAFDRAYHETRERADSMSTQLLIRPSSSGILSDAVCTLNWCARGGGQDAQLFLDPIGWVVPSMMRDIEDHLDRIVELCLEMVDRGRVWGVLLRSVRWDEDQTVLIPASVVSGQIDTEMILSKLGPLIRASGRCALLDVLDIPRIRTWVPNEP